MYRFVLIIALLLSCTRLAAEAQPLLPPSPLDRLGFVSLARPVHRNRPLAQGLEAWWRVVPGWAGGTTWYDLMNVHHGTLTAMTTAGSSGWSGAARPGGHGALRLDGVDDCIQVTGLLGSPAALTLSAWVSLGTSGSGGSDILSLGDVISLRLDAPGVGIENSYYIGSSTWNTTTFNATYAGTGWHHVAYVVNPAGASQVAYVDGISVASTTFSTAITWAGLGTNTFIGRHGNGGTTQFWAGQVDDVRVWRRALTVAEIAALYQESRQGDPGLLNRMLPMVPATTPPTIRGRFMPFFSTGGR